MAKKYRAAIRFKDLTDKYIYSKGETYPRKGVNPSEQRIKALTTKNNKSEVVLIEDVKPKRKSKALKE